MLLYQLLSRIKSDCDLHKIRGSVAGKIWAAGLQAHLADHAESLAYDRMAAAQAESDDDMNFVLGCNCSNNHC